MKSIVVSKSLQALLCAVVALTVVALLKTEPLALRDSAAEGPRSPARSHQAPEAPEAAPAWARPDRGAWTPDDASPGTAAAAAAPVAAVQSVVAATPDVAVPPPSAPDPGLVYLGRIEQDRRHQVFLGRGAASQVVEIGGAIDAQWKVERATATQVELRHLPTNSLRAIAIQ